MPNPPINLCSSILEFIFEFQKRNKLCTDLVLRKHYNLSQRYLSAAVTFLSENNLIVISDTIVLSPEVFDQLDKSLVNSRKVIMETLMSFQPFIDYIYFLNNGKSERESLKMVTSLYSIKQNEEIVSKVFNDWISNFGINISGEQARNKTLDGINDAVQNKLYANNFIKIFLGEDFSYISPQVVKELSEAIKHIPQDNEMSVNEAGRALEDFLRLDLAKDIDLTKCSGIGEIGNELNKHVDYPKKLNNTCVGLTNIRSMGKAHGADKTLKLSWSVSEHGAIGYLILVLTLIKSYIAFRQRKKLIF